MDAAMTGLRNAPERAISLSLRYPAGEPLREGRRRGDRAEWQAVTEQSIGMTLAVRNLMTDLRSSAR